MALRLLLRLHGWRLTGDPLELAKQIVAVAERAGAVDEATNRFAGWLRANIQAQ